MASVRAAQLGKRFKVEKHPEDHPGFTKVMCVPDDYEEVDHHQPILEYGVGREKLQDMYGFNLDELHWAHIHEGKPVEVQAQIIDPDDLKRRKRMIVQVPMPGFNVGVELFEDHMRFTALPKGWKPHVWEAKADWLEAEGRKALADAEAREREERRAALAALHNVMD
jgi:hypothetical protein